MATYQDTTDPADQPISDLIEQILALVPAQLQPPPQSTWIACAGRDVDLSRLYQAAE